MKIAIIDVAAENSGALSVLMDFYNYIRNSNIAKKHKWFFFTSFPKLEETDYIVNIRNPKIKKSKIRRFIWDNFGFKKLEKKYNFDLIFSFQNSAVKAKSKNQIVYFHNVLLLAENNKFSFFKKEERKYAFYSKILSYYTKNSYKKIRAIIVQTNTVKEKMIRQYGIENIYVINPNVHIDENIGSFIKTQKKLGFFYPANPETFKNHMIIVDAFNKVSKMFNDLELIFTFDENTSNYAKKIIDYSKDNKRIKFVGYLQRKKVLENYINYNLVWASSLESYPIPFQEAKLLGSCIIAPDEDYALEILNDYNNCIFYNKNNIDSLSKAMIESLDRGIQFNNKTNELENSWDKVLNIIGGE